VKIDIAVSSPIPSSSRTRQLEAMFDVPHADAARLKWRGELDVESRPWNVGLIVGPSGAGKSTIARALFGPPAELEWGAGPVVDSFDPEIPLDGIAAVCQAVGFNTIPAWLRPFGVLSTGERFRVDLARRMVETPADRIIVVDEFTSVVDRQVGQIGAHAVQKWTRRNKRQFVGVSCHYDVVDWLQPDWLFEPATMTQTWRSLQQRPSVDAEVRRVPPEWWRIFAPFHYLTADLKPGARCYCLLANGEPAAFAGVLPGLSKHLWRVSRLVTLPDWQGLGLAFILVDNLAASYKALGGRLRTYPAHPSLIRSFDRSPVWTMIKKPGTYQHQSTGQLGKRPGGHVSRPCGVFEYIGPPWPDARQAQRFVATYI
jgi:ABC-type iron transport system FetAB ATPase subunit